MGPLRSCRVVTASGSIRKFPFSSQYTSLTGLAASADPDSVGPIEASTLFELGLGVVLELGVVLGLGFCGSDLGEEEEEDVPPRKPNICSIFLALGFLLLLSCVSLCFLIAGEDKLWKLCSEMAPQRAANFIHQKKERLKL